MSALFEIWLSHPANCIPVRHGLHAHFSASGLREEGHPQVVNKGTQPPFKVTLLDTSSLFSGSFSQLMELQYLSGPSQVFSSEVYPCLNRKTNMGTQYTYASLSDMLVLTKHELCPKSSQIYTYVAEYCSISTQDCHKYISNLFWYSF